MAPPLIVSPKEIRPSLSRIWESLEATNKIRACLFNLIVFTQKNSRNDYFHQIVQKIVEKFPCRIIAVTADEKGKESIEAKVSVVSGGHEKSDFACDLIEFSLPPSMLNRVPFLILPHILPDLPVYLLWGENIAEFPELLESLSKLSHRIIFDSETASNLPSFARSALKLQESGSLSLADLNWARLEPWRSLLLLSFSGPEKLEELRKTKEIEIVYNSRASDFFCQAKIPPTYLQGWIACQLGWKLKETRTEGENVLFLYETGQLIWLKQENNSELEPGAILSIQIASEKEHTISFSRTLKLPDQIQIKCETPNHCELPTYYLFSKRELGQSLVREIYHPGTSSHFITLLTHLATL